MPDWLQRRDSLNHFVILNVKHPQKTLVSYIHGSRTYLGLDKECPLPRPVASFGRIIEIPQLGACITDMNALQHNDMSADAFWRTTTAVG